MARKGSQPVKELYGISGYADRKIERIRSESGMTFLECLTAVSISVIILASIFSFSFLLSKSQLEDEINVKLTNEARQLMDKFVWGTRKAGELQRRGIAEGRQPVPNGNQIDYTDVDGVSHSIRLNNNNIEYKRGNLGGYSTLLDLNGAPAFDVAQYSTNLTFSYASGNPRAILINLVLGQKLHGRWYSATLSSTVFCRNA